MALATIDFVHGTKKQCESEPFLSYQGNRLWQIRDGHSASKPLCAIGPDR
jgi:hypothetical protein